MLVGFISTYPVTSPTSWCRVMAQNPLGDLFRVPVVSTGVDGFYAVC